MMCTKHYLPIDTGLQIQHIINYFQSSLTIKLLDSQVVFIFVNHNLKMIEGIFTPKNILYSAILSQTAVH